MSSLSRLFKKKVKKSPAEENVELLGDEGEAVKTPVQSYEALAAYSKSTPCQVWKGFDNPNFADDFLPIVNKTTEKVDCVSLESDELPPPRHHASPEYTTRGNLAIGGYLDYETHCLPVLGKHEKNRLEWLIRDEIGKVEYSTAIAKTWLQFYEKAVARDNLHISYTLVIFSETTYDAVIEETVKYLAQRGQYVFLLGKFRENLELPGTVYIKECADLPDSVTVMHLGSHDLEELIIFDWMNERELIVFCFDHACPLSSFTHMYVFVNTAFSRQLVDFLETNQLVIPNPNAGFDDRGYGRLIIDHTKRLTLSIAHFGLSFGWFGRFRQEMTSFFGNASMFTFDDRLLE